MRFASIGEAQPDINCVRRLVKANVKADREGPSTITFSGCVSLDRVSDNPFAGGFGFADRNGVSGGYGGGADQAECKSCTNAERSHRKSPVNQFSQSYRTSERLLPT